MKQPYSAATPLVPLSSWHRCLPTSASWCFCPIAGRANYTGAVELADSVACQVLHQCSMCFFLCFSYPNNGEKHQYIVKHCLNSCASVQSFSMHGNFQSLLAHKNFRDAFCSWILVPFAISNAKRLQLQSYLSDFWIRSVSFHLHTSETEL